jgi:hypothetical protein
MEYLRNHEHCKEQVMKGFTMKPWTVDMDVTFLATDQEDALRNAHKLADALEDIGYEVTLGENHREGNE